jgi:hypothetical protein
MQPEKKIVLNLVLVLVGVSMIYWAVTSRRPRQEKD